MILDCYRLGKYYGCDPSLFLSKTLSEIDRHIYWTDMLLERVEVEQRAAEMFNNG